MTKKHFEAVAKSIRTSIDAARERRDNASRWLNLDACNEARAQIEALEDLASDLSYEFSTFSHSFDSERFLDACGVAE